MSLPVPVLVEGVTDRGAARAVGKRMRTRVRTYLMYENTIGKLGIVKANATRYDKFVLLKDLHTFYKQSLRRLHSGLCNAMNGSLRDRITLVIVMHEIESWFLADSVALGKVFNCRIGTEIHNPEDIQNAAEELDNLLMRRCGKRYYKSQKVAEYIMKNADFEKVSRKAPSFKRFLDVLTS